MGYRILQGDVMDRLKQLPNGSVHCVITSPPYWSLRDYGTAKWEDGDPSCNHVTGNQVPDNKAKGAITAGVRPGSDSSICKKCGAIRVDSQLGLEKTPEEYIAKMVEVFREVKRVLRSDGTAWVNMGDSYAGSSMKGGDQGKRVGGGTKMLNQLNGNTGSCGVPPGLKPKDLCGIPWMLAFALRADGWWLRSDIIWHKPNPMPESCTDRPTKAHEYVFLLSKSAKYFFDQEAVREKSKRAGDFPGGDYIGRDVDEKVNSGWLNKTGVPTNRNIRSVWTISTQPYPQAHFATFPEKLAEPCIKAGTSEHGVCPECGGPWERVVEKPKPPTDKYTNSSKPESIRPCAGGGGMGQKLQNFYNENPTTTIGWQPNCTHNLSPIPATVLDPFSGSGTTGVVALKLDRDFVGIELNPKYVKMSLRRLFVTEAVVEERKERGM